MTKQLSCFVLFSPNFYVFQDLHSGREKEICKKNKGFYILKNVCDLYRMHRGNTHQKLVVEVDMQECNLWHRRLGFPCSQSLNSLSLLRHNTDLELLNKYYVFQLAKQTRLPFPTSESRIAKYFDLVHMDLWGPYKSPTFNKKHYFPDCCGWLW